MNREAPRQDFSVLDAGLNQQAEVENAHSIEEQNNQRLRHKIQELFREQFLPVGGETEDGEWGRGVFGADDKILTLLEAPMGEDNRITKEQHERVRMFFDELVAYVKEQRRDPEQRQGLMDYLRQWRVTAFFVSPNISNFLTMEDEMFVAAEFSGIPELRQTLASEVGGELVYNLQFMHGKRAEFFEDVLASATPEQKLKLIDYMVVIGAGALNQGWAEEAADDIKQTLQALRDNETESPFVHYAASSALEQFSDHQDNMGAFFWSQADVEERQRILQHVVPDSESFVENHFAQLSRDSVGSFDARGTLQSLALVEAGDFVRDPEAVAVADVRDALEVLGSMRQGDGRTTMHLMDNIEEKFFHAKGRLAGVKWNEVAPQVGGAVWQRFAEDKQAMDDVVAEWSAFQHETKEKMEAEGFTLDDIREELDVSRWEFDQALIAPFDDLQTIAQHLSTQPKFFEDVQKYLVGLQKEAKGQEIHFDLVDDLSLRTDILPNGGAKDMDTVDLLKVMHRPGMRQQIEADLGVSLGELTLREQVQMLSYLASVDTTTSKEAFAVIQKFGIAAARAFLSCEYGKKQGDAILKIAKEFPVEIAKGVFERYAAILDVAEKDVNELAETFFASGTHQNLDRQQLMEDLLRRGKDVITSVASSKDQQEAITRLERANADTVLFASIFKTAFKGGKEAVDFSKIRGLAFGSRTPEEFTDDERDKMLAVFDENWKDQDQIAARAFRKMLQSKSAAENKDSHFYVLKKDQDFSAFLRLDHRDDLEPSAYYFGSMNVAPEYRDSAIGGAFMQQTLDKEAAEHTLFAHVVPDAIVGARYVEDGFVITGVDTVTVDGQETVELAIRRDDRRRNRFHGTAQQATTKQLLQGITEVDVQKFQYPKEKDAFLLAIRSATQQGKVATRYFVDPKDRSVRHLAFESDVSPDDSIRVGS